MESLINFGPDTFLWINSCRGSVVLDAEEVVAAWRARPNPMGETCDRLLLGDAVDSQNGSSARWRFLQSAAIKHKSLVFPSFWIAIR
uniref:Uncharacterized protein n=1 Tax=Physcomitrium patens TaxID=3218 RepID=A0A2K1IRU2_PHYPA|nr:hypothetical protein PHYPA_026125 [Physcomitrium patens]